MKKYNYSQIFGYIVSFKKRNDGLSPSIRELMSKFNISSTNVVHYILRVLEKEGKIKLYGKYTSRGIKVVGGKWTYKGITNEEL
jgi:SOS-response transcriptional repressor LexA